MNLRNPNLDSLTVAVVSAGGDASARESVPAPATAAVANFFDLAESLQPATIDPAPVAIHPVSAALRLCGESPVAVRKDTSETHAEAERLAGVCREFDRLLAGGAHSLRTAAAALGRSPSFFSGENSPYTRFKRQGLTGLLPKQTARASTLPVAGAALELPEWFIPAARFFYLLTNRTHNSGSVPEAVRRTISLPNLPFGWQEALAERLCKAIACDTVPVCPVALREAILARISAGQAVLPPALHRQILVNASTVHFSRNPRDWSLQNQSAPGSQRRHTNRDTGERSIMQPGDWFGGDDATPGIAVCVPCTDIITPCSEKFGVLLGRFQWLAYHDARADKILAWDYVVRPRGSYRAEDILNGMGAVVRTHGVPNKGWQFEGGAWNSKLVKQAIELLGNEHWRTYSPHQKAIEAVFNKVWTRLAVQFPHADMGRYRSENDSNCKLYEACKAGHQDPKKYFPTIDQLTQVFTEEVAEHNARYTTSEHYGRWIPDSLFAARVSAAPLRAFSEEMEWIFAPHTAERTVRGMLVTCRVPMFENFSVPFDFGADWLPQYHGCKVRLHFNPRLPRCTAKLVLLENHTGPDGRLQTPGTILGDAQLVGETAGYIRYILNWGDDNQRAGYLQRQRAGNFVRRETRGQGTGGRVAYRKSELRNGIDAQAIVEQSTPVDIGQDATISSGCNIAGSGDPEAQRSTGGLGLTAEPNHNNRAGRLESPRAGNSSRLATVPPVAGRQETPGYDRAALIAELADLERQTDDSMA